jgi:hypothetical protein
MRTFVMFYSHLPKGNNIAYYSHLAANSTDVLRTICLHRTGVYKFIKNLGSTSKFQTPE